MWKLVSHHLLHLPPCSKGPSFCHLKMVCSNSSRSMKLLLLQAVCSWVKELNYTAPSQPSLTSSQCLTLNLFPGALEEKNITSCHLTSPQ